MVHKETYEGTPIQLAEQLRSLPETRKYRMTLTSEEDAEEGLETLETVIARMTGRTQEEIAADREKLLHSSPPPRDLPEGKTILDVVMGKWPGNETDKQILEALERLS